MLNKRLSLAQIQTLFEQVPISISVGKIHGLNFIIHEIVILNPERVGDALRVKYQIFKLHYNSVLTDTFIHKGLIKQLSCSLVQFP